LNKLKFKIANAILQNGGIIAYPTEAVFGLGCDPMNPQAIEKLLQLKNRSIDKGLILVASDFEQIKPYINKLSIELFSKVMQSWPGPINWLLPANPVAPAYLRGKHTLQAVRISNHPAIQALCHEFGGAIVSTSANISKQPPAKNSIQVRLRFGNKIDYVLNGNIGYLKQPCEIRNALNDKIIRKSN
jgi:L-threonylcarbamoyladenylate synthase